MAAAIFITAAAVAVVRAASSDSEPAAAAPQTQAAAEPSAPPPSSAPQTPAAQTQSQPQSQPQSPPADQTDAASQARAEPTAEPPASQQQESPAQPAQTQSPAWTTADADALRGFSIPIAGACITEFENHLPNATRAYRNNGTHEGLDFYEWASCTVVDQYTPILAAKAGVVIRADLDYVDITPADWDRFVAANWEGEAILDELRGRQVWIDHGRGVVTRYAHLSAIAQGIAVGVEVEQRQVIGFPGESGQREVYTDENDIHLHFEIRVGDGWLGQAELPQAARQLYLIAFGLASD